MYKRVVQHFISWVVVAGLSVQPMFSTSDGLVNQLIEWSAANGSAFSANFRGVLVAPTLIGWGTIIILAALAGVSPELTIGIIRESTLPSIAI